MEVLCVDATLEKNLGTLFGYIMVQTTNEEFVKRLSSIRDDFQDTELVSLIDKAIALHEHKVTRFVKFPETVILSGYSLNNTRDLIHARVDICNRVKSCIKQYVDYITKDIKTFYPYFNEAYLTIVFGEDQGVQ